MRLQIALFGRTNVGKSTFLNMLAGQDVSIISELAGTTTDVVEKSMELRPVGPVVLIDTAGLNDITELAAKRIAKTKKIFARADIFVIITVWGVWGSHEERVVREAKKRNAPIIIVVNKTDITALSKDFQKRLAAVTPRVISCSCVSPAAATAAIEHFRAAVSECAKLLRDANGDDRAAIAADLIPANGTAVLVVPIDSGAPRGRLILPQVQTIRDLLDHGKLAVVVRDTEYERALTRLDRDPDIVICDSQAIKKIAEATPSRIPLTTFSLLFARLKGDIKTFAAGASALKSLAKGDRVLIAEACSHHAGGDDIGRVKIPALLKKHVGVSSDADLQIDFYNGRDFPVDLSKYKLVIHCGACMLTRHEMVDRIRAVCDVGVPICNYGMVLAYLGGEEIFNRIIKPF